MTTDPGTSARSPASVDPGVDTQAAVKPLFFTYDLQCNANSDQATDASKLRLTGELCPDGRSPSSVTPPHIDQITVTNTANKFTATVFTDSNAGKFSTDYIPLNTGKNLIQIQFAYPGGKISTQNLTIDKSEALPAKNGT